MRSSFTNRGDDLKGTIAFNEMGKRKARKHLDAGGGIKYKKIYPSESPGHVVAYRSGWNDEMRLEESHRRDTRTSRQILNRLAEI